MIITSLVLSLLPMLVTCTGEGNIRLLEAEVAAALKTCALPYDHLTDNNANQRQRRSVNNTRLDLNDTSIGLNQYAHEKRNSSDMKEQMYILNATENDNGSYNNNNGEKYMSSVPRPAAGGVYNKTHMNTNRTRRNEPLLNKQDTDQCLSQCIFANLQVFYIIISQRMSTLLVHKPSPWIESRRKNEESPPDQCSKDCSAYLAYVAETNGISCVPKHEGARKNIDKVDSRGIPREAEFWNKVQSSVSSQQSRAALRDQTRACFQELQSEAEDNECSYSNKLERCLMLRFADRKINGTQRANNRNT